VRLLDALQPRLGDHEVVDVGDVHPAAGLFGCDRGFRERLCFTGFAASPGFDTNGGYADYLKTSARSVVKIGSLLEPSDVAALADAGLTAYHAAAKAARRLAPRDRCVIIGAGGLGHIAIQVLKVLSPAQLIVVDHNAEAVKLAVSLGADHGVVADGTQVEQVLELTGGHGAEAVIDFVGEGGATREGVQMLCRAGDYHVVGYGDNLNVPTIDIISTEINFIGNLVGSYNDLCDLMALAARGAVHLHTAKYRLDDFQSAIDDLDAGNVRGRAILIP
jgi:NAD+-dependent secondary alcohol dehydrogenase Adh1